MKVAIACFAALSSLTVSTAAHSQDATVYGQIRLTINNAKTGDKPGTTELRDNASRMGVRGREDLGNGMTALYGFEYGFEADTGNFATASNPMRYSFVGLRGAAGTIALGRLDSSQPTGSPLYSQVTAITSFAPNDAGATAIGTSMLNSRNRVSNAIGYASPIFDNFSIRARFYYRGAGTTVDPEDAARSFDIGANYASGPLKAGIGFGKDGRRGGLAANEFDSKWQVGARYNFSLVEPYAMYGVDYYNNTATTRRKVPWWIVGARLPLGHGAVVMNLMKRDVQANLSGTRPRGQLAYTYPMSKRTELQFYIDRDRIDDSRSNVTVRAIGTGMRHDF